MNINRCPKCGNRDLDILGVNPIVGKKRRKIIHWDWPDPIKIEVIGYSCGKCGKTKIYQPDQGPPPL